MQQLTEVEKRRVCKLLSDLVGIDSAMTSADQSERVYNEARIADYLIDYLQQLGMVVEKYQGCPGRDNLVAHWPNQDGGKSLMFSAHMDTVTVEGMTVDPFSAQIIDNRMYGRGTCDTKGSIAAMLSALALAKEKGRLPADKIYFSATVSEETGCDGSMALMQTDFRTDAAIVGEPTHCRLVTMHKGPLWLEIETHGQSGHASMAKSDKNAIELMARTVRFIHGDWTDYIQGQQHPQLGKSTAAVTMIDGGANINIVPSHCRVRVDCRFIPGKSYDKLLKNFNRMLADYLGGEDLFTVKTIKSFPPLNCPADAAIAAELLDICRDFNGQDTPGGVHYFADAGPFSQAGITSVLFGPGDIAQAHTVDEYLQLDQLYQATEILLTLLVDNAGRSIIELE